MKDESTNIHQNIVSSFCANYLSGEKIYPHWRKHTDVFFLSLDISAHIPAKLPYLRLIRGHALSETNPIQQVNKKN